MRPAASPWCRRDSVRGDVLFGASCGPALGVRRTPPTARRASVRNDSRLRLGRRGDSVRSDSRLRPGRRGDSGRNDWRPRLGCRGDSVCGAALGVEGGFWSERFAAPPLRLGCQGAPFGAGPRDHPATLNESYWKQFEYVPVSHPPLPPQKHTYTVICRTTLGFASGHTASNAPDLFRTPKLSGAGPG